MMVRLQSGMRLFIMAALLISMSCARIFPENPAGSKVQKYNLREIVRLRTEMDRFCADEQRRAVIRGLLWLLDFTQDDGNFTFIFANYIPMLYEIYSVNDAPAVRDILRSVLRNEAARGASTMAEIFTNGNIQDIILMIGIFDRVGAPTGQYLEYYNTKLRGYDGAACRTDFYQYIRDCNYDKLTDVMCDYSHFRFAYGGAGVRIGRLPPDYRTEFLGACAELPFKYTAGDEGYHDQNYFVTHMVFVMTGYSEYPLPDTAYTRRLKKYILDNFHTVRYRLDDLDLLGEYAECMKIFGLEMDGRVREAMRYIMARQCPDGSWLRVRTKDDDPYDIFHPSWTSISALHYTKLPAR